MNEFGKLTPAQKATMQNYRTYIVGNDGHFNSSEDIIADDDENAVTIAERLLNRHDVELWRLERRIAVLPHKHQIAVLPLKVEPSSFEKIVRSPSMW